MIRAWWGERFTESALRMAEMPAGSRLFYGDDGLRYAMLVVAAIKMGGSSSEIPPRPAVDEEATEVTRLLDGHNNKGS